MFAAQQTMVCLPGVVRRLMSASTGGRSEGRLSAPREAVWIAILVACLAPLVLASRSSAAVRTSSREDVARYVRDHVLDGVSTGISLWSTPVPLDRSHVARDPDSAVADVRFPFRKAWLVLIDDHPKANWGHPCRWVFVNADLREHTKVQRKEFPPTVWAHRGSGPEVPLVQLTMLP
jgi:hypothetical protein